MGTTLLFWGAMTDRPAIGLMLALVVEACHWTRLRWDFDESATARGWQLSMAALIVTTALLWLENRMTAVPQLLTWLPLLLLPMQFIQSYGLKDSLPLRAFSLFAKQRRERARKLGLEDSVLRLNFGNFYFAACLVAATLGKAANTWLNLTGLIVLGGWMLAHYTRGGRIAFAMALVMAAVLALAGQLGIAFAIDRLSGGSSAPEFNPNFTKTRIGDLAEIKLSPDIMWRLKVQGGGRPPALLRTAGFNSYAGGNWRSIVPESDGPDFQDLTTLELRIGEPYYLVRADADKEAIRPELPRFDLRGAATNNSPLPLPGTAASLTGFELDGIERNSLGTIRLSPAKSILSGTALWGDSANPEIGPLVEVKIGEDGRPYQTDVDLQVFSIEKPAVARVAEELGLADAPTVAEKLSILQSWFFSEFTYTRYLSIEATEKDPAIGKFLTETRRGHCEYFATAAALLLREAGVPTRYAVGYAVMELDGKRREWVVRGLHRHAWVRVWDEESGLWVDFDPTPPDWLAMETQRESSMQWLHDAFLRVREDFFIWRNKPGNRVAAFTVMGAIALGVFIFVARRLWKSRRQLQHANDEIANLGPTIRTPLHGLERLARKRIGPRPKGQTFATWLGLLRNLLGDPAPLDEAISLHQRLRFDPAPAASSLSERLAELAGQLEAALQPDPAKK